MSVVVLNLCKSINESGFLRFTDIISFQELMQNEILECMKYGSSTKKYSSYLRLFCLTVHFHSPRAYEYIREKFNRNIPAPRTMRSWFSSIDGSPGLTDVSFDGIEQKAKELEADGKVLICGLIYDEMSIRQASQWNQHKKNYFGHISHGNEQRQSYDASCTPLTKNALVLMISGISASFKIPIGYFFINKLNGEEKASILMETMYRLSKTGIKLASVTFDGDPANIKAVQILGADFQNDHPFFINPHDETKVYVVLDPPHMLKLGRNTLGNKGTLYDEEDGEIKWRLIDDLITTQSRQSPQERKLCK